MRLGLLGPAENDLAALAAVAGTLLSAVRVDRAVYLGDDGALEETVGRWAASLVGGDPSDEAIWDRAVEVAAQGTAAQIDEVLKAERARQRLKALEALPEGGRSIEMFGDRVAVLIHDKAQLDEEDIFSATFLVYGKSDLPSVRKIGTRWFLSPGTAGPNGGGLVLDDAEDEVVATFYGTGGRAIQSTTLSVARTAKLRVLGEP